MGSRPVYASLPTGAAAILGLTGGLAVLSGLLLVLPVPAALGYDLPAAYRYLLAGMGLSGGGCHLLAGWWAWHRTNLFPTVSVTLVGMVLLQVSVPFDVLALALLGLSRHEFDSDPDGDTPEV